MACSILIIDRDPCWTEEVAKAFLPYLTRVHSASSVITAITILRASVLELVILDVGTVPLDRYNANLCRRRRPGLIVTTSDRSYDLAVDALRAGASDILERPVPPRMMVGRATVELETRIASPHYLGRRLDKFLRENHKCHNLSLSKLSSAFGISESYASLLLREEPWRGFRARLAYHRVFQAKRLLTETDEPLYQIAEECGFSSPSRLSEIFSRLVGVGPKRFRQRKATALGLVE